MPPVEPGTRTRTASCAEPADDGPAPDLKQSRQRAFLEALHETTLGLMQRLDLDDLLQALVVRAAALLGAPQGYVYLLDPERDLLVLKTTAYAEPDVQPPASLRRHEGLTGTVWATDSLQVANDYAHWHAPLARAVALGISAVAAVPLHVDGRFAGVLGVSRLCSDQAFDDDALVFLTRFAQLASVALDNARLYAALRHELGERRRVEAALRSSERRLRSTFEEAAVGICYIGPDGRWLRANKKWCEILGYAPEELGQLTWRTITHPEEQASTLEDIRAFVAGKLQSITVERRCLRKDGSTVWLNLTSAAVHDPEDMDYYVATVEDITARKQAELALEENEARLRALTEHASDIMTIHAPDGTNLFTTRAVAHIMGRPATDVDGRRFDHFVHPEDLARANDAFKAVLEAHGASVGFEVRARHADESWRTLEVVLHNLLDDPAVRGIVSNVRDITDRKAIEQALRHQALHDALTGLPNRTLLRDRLEQTLLVSRRQAAPLALFFLDLNRFKDVNDTLGHHVGDLLLQQLGPRLQRALRDSDTVARLGGDEFAVLLPGTDGAGAEHAVRRLRAVLEEPVEIDGHRLEVDASVGVALYPEHGEDANTLMRRADVAMYIAKRTGAGHAFYTVELDEHNPERLALVGALRRTLDAAALDLHFQPVVDRDGAIHHVEALARWHHPEHGAVAPGRFIPLAEQTGLIGRLTQRVVAKAVQQGARWLDAGTPVPIAVNISARTLHDPHLPEMLAEILQQYSLPAGFLRLEFTEGAIMAEPERTAMTLRRLRRMGLRLSVDDFGTGYSSLAYLQRLPVDELKIDRSFVQQMATDAGDAVIVRGTINLAHTLGLNAVAVGVEDRATYERLTELGCDLVQGYYTGRPVPGPELDGRLVAAVPAEPYPGAIAG